MPRTILVGVFSFNQYSTHSIIDDKYYHKFFQKFKNPFIFYCSKYLFDILRNKYGSTKNFKILKDYDNDILQQIFNVLKINVQNEDEITFSGYTEKMILLLLLKNFYKNFRLILISTNNHGTERLHRLKRYMTFFFKIVNPYLDKILVHSIVEQQLLIDLFPILKGKVFVKSSHLFSIKSFTKKDVKDSKYIISFFGPPKYDKPIKPILDLIIADKKKQFNYCLYRVGNKIDNRFSKSISKLKNVKIYNKFQSNQDYQESLLKTDLLILTHTYGFYPKISGQFFDAVNYQIPFISLQSDLINSYNSSYGLLGFLYEFDDSSWCEKFLSDFSKEKMHLISKNLKKMSLDRSVEDNEAILRDILHC